MSPCRRSVFAQMKRPKGVIGALPPPWPGPGSPRGVFEENVWYFYDQTCGVETPDSSICHVTVFPNESCQDALIAHVGLISARMRFTRVRYDAALAAAFRVGTITTRAGADLAVVTEGMRDEQRVMYRYFTPDSSDIAEGVIPAPGWRRLLTFSAIVRNDGNGPLHFGDPTDPNNPWVKSHVFEFSPCHEHYHFIVVPRSGDVSFTCPAVRDAATAGTGGYSLYTAPITPSLESDAVTCTGG